MARPPTNEEFLNDPRLRLALHFIVMDVLVRLNVTPVPDLIESSVETTITAMSDVEGMAKSLDAVRYMQGV